MKTTATGQRKTWRGAGLVFGIFRNDWVRTLPLDSLPATREGRRSASTNWGVAWRRVGRKAWEVREGADFIFALGWE